MRGKQKARKVKKGKKKVFDQRLEWRNLAEGYVKKKERRKGKWKKKKECLKQKKKKKKKKKEEKGT